MSEIIYIYCHACKKLVFKGSKEEASSYNRAFIDNPKTNPHYRHTHTYGRLWYFNQWYPEINTEEWNKGMKCDAEGCTVKANYNCRGINWCGSAGCAEQLVQREDRTPCISCGKAAIADAFNTYPWCGSSECAQKIMMDEGNKL